MNPVPQNHEQAVILLEGRSFSVLLYGPFLEEVEVRMVELEDVRLRCGEEVWPFYGNVVLRQNIFGLVGHLYERGTFGAVTWRGFEASLHAAMVERGLIQANDEAARLKLARTLCVLSAFLNTRTRVKTYKVQMSTYFVTFLFDVSRPQQ